MPAVVQHPYGYAAIKNVCTKLAAQIARRPILPRTGEDQDVVASCGGRVGTHELMDVLTDAGSRPQRGPVVDEDAHLGRVQSFNQR